MTGLSRRQLERLSYRGPPKDLSVIQERVDLFRPVPEEEPLTRIERYAKSDARSGGWNDYSDRLTGERLAVYEAAFRAERERMLSGDVLGAPEAT